MITELRKGSDSLTRSKGTERNTTLQNSVKLDTLIAQEKNCLLDTQQDIFLRVVVFFQFSVITGSEYATLISKPCLASRGVKNEVNVGKKKKERKSERRG